MKTVLKVLAGLVLVVALGLVAVFYFTAGLARTADDFFAAARAHDMKAAYTHLSKSLQHTTSEAELRTYLHKHGLDAVVATDWSSRSIQSGRGSLKGTVRTKDGGRIPVSLQLVKDDDGWKIHSLVDQPARLGAQPKAPVMPSRQEITSLVSGTVQLFAQSVADKNMQAFHGGIAELWRKQTSVAQLNQAFAPFFGTGTRPELFAQLKPVFTADPVIKANGLLEVTGYYPTKGKRFYFQHRYVQEAGKWKLSGLHESVGPPEQ